MSYVNIAFYKFVTLMNLNELREKFRHICSVSNLKGTIILGTEGINSCLVGADKGIDTFITWMREDSRFAGIEFKKSYSASTPFRKMVVKFKKEIIPIGVDSVIPEKSTGPYVEPAQLKEWLDNKEDIIFLDTRNDYEVQVGTFRNAINPELKTFREFPKWIAENFKQYKKTSKKIVTFCTGGIRCEKATAFMEEEGFHNVYQIHGGILKYFEETARLYPNEDNYYDGDCFVFDSRVAVDKTLQPTAHKVCYKCWAVLSPADLEHVDYVLDEQCPHCAPLQRDKKIRLAQKRKINDAKFLQMKKAKSAKKKEELQKEMVTRGGLEPPT